MEREQRVEGKSRINTPGFFPFEDEIRKMGFAIIAGVDEAGRGPLAGPVVASAVILPYGWSDPDVADSKTINEKKRMCVYERIMQKAISVGVGVVSVEEIDRINIYRASLKAMLKAIKSLSVEPDYILIDGKAHVDIQIPQRSIIKGDRCCLSIAAASIIAKVERDRIMEQIHREFPQYNFKKHKGYPTSAHIVAIKKYGPCPYHRKSFRPVSELKLL